MVLDVNVYLDVARYLGAPFSWDAFEAAVHDHRTDPIPNPIDPAIDSLRAIHACLSRFHPDGRPITVWTSDHIDILVAAKASDAKQGISDPGLGWGNDEAQALVTDLVWEVIDRSAGDTAGEVVRTYGHPPLDHEDGLVYATALAAGQDDAYIDVVCLTRDVGFQDAQLPGSIEVRSPAEWLSAFRSAQRIAAMRRMSPPSA